MTRQRNKAPALREGAVGPVDQFQMLLFASKDTRLSSACDLAVLAEIVDRCEKEQFDARPTSVGHLMRETGRQRRTILYSIGRLLEFGYISVATEKSGATARTYSLNWDWVRAVGHSMAVEIHKRREARKHGARSRTKNQQLAQMHNGAPLREVMVQHSALLDGIMVHDPTPQTYSAPNGAMNSGSDTCAPDAGLAPAPGEVPPPETVEIFSAETRSDAEGTYLDLQFDSGEIRTIVCEHSHSSKQQEGQRELGLLAEACGLDEIEDGSELVGKTLIKETVRYGPDQEASLSFRAVE